MRNYLQESVETARATRESLSGAYNQAVRDDKQLLAKCLLAAWQDAIALHANLEELNEITTHDQS